MKFFFLYLLMVVVSTPVSGQTCLCDSIQWNPCGNLYEVVSETFMVTHCSNQVPQYITIKKEVIKQPCLLQLVTYPCSCADKNRFLKNGYKTVQPEEYQWIEWRDCENNVKTSKMLTKYRKVERVLPFPSPIQ